MPVLLDLFVPWHQVAGWWQPAQGTRRKLAALRVYAYVTVAVFVFPSSTRGVGTAPERSVQ